MGEKKVGRPKFNWYIMALEQYWKYIADNGYPLLKHITFDQNDKEHIKTIIEAAEHYIY